MLNSLPYIEIKPQEPPHAVVIFLHGLGASANEFLSIVPKLNLPSSTYFILPQAPNRPITINQHMVMPGWYDIIEMKGYGQEDESGILDSNQLIQKLLNKAEKFVPSNQIFLVGFSQGGAMAIYSGLTYPKKIGGIACLSGYVPINKTFTNTIHPTNKETKIFMAHGQFDTLLPLEYGQLSHNMLTELGYTVHWQEYPIEHSISSEQLQDLSLWLMNAMNIPIT